MAGFNPDYSSFIIPHPTKANHSKLAQLQADGELRILPWNLPFPFYSHAVNRGHATDGRWLVGVRPAPRGQAVPDRIYRARLQPGGRWLQPLPEIKLPKYHQVKTLLLHGGWLYIGGAYDHLKPYDYAAAEPIGHEYFSRLNLAEEAPGPEPVPLPVDFGPGKAVDDLLRDGNQLLVVDNVVSPKYLFLYKLLPGTALPEWLQTYELPFRRPTEHIVKACWSEDFIVLLSRSAHMGGGGQHVSVLRRDNLKPVFIGANYYRMRRGYNTAEHNPEWYLHDIALEADQLLLACGSRGLARITLRLSPLWPKIRTSYTTWERQLVDDEWQKANPKRHWKTRLADELDLNTAGAAEGIEWLPLPAGRPPVETVRFLKPELILLTGRHSRVPPASTWLHTL